MSEQPADIHEQPQKQQQLIQEPQQKKPSIQYFPPTQQPYQYKIFINECNSYIGSQLVELFRNDDQIEVNPNIIVSTLNRQCKVSGEIGDDVCRIIEMRNKTVFNSVLMDSDIIVFHLNENNLQDFEYTIKFLRQLAKNNGNFQEANKKKKVICISSIKTWTATHTDQGSFLNNNILIRNNVNTYLVELENLCLDINNFQKNIEAIMIYSGIIYGYGQNQLFGRFKRALQQEQSLLIYGKGNNYLPMIHLQDLCSITKNLAFKGFIHDQNQTKDKLKYYFGVDHLKITQQELIKTIAETLGNGSIENIPIQQAWLQPDLDVFMMNFQLEQQSIPKLQQWHSKEGIIQNMGKVVSQFNNYRGLKPNKIAIVGAPAAGKTQIAEFLKSAYGLPLLTVNSVIEELKNEQDEFAQEMKVKMEDLRAEKIEEQRKAFEDAKKKKKGKKDAVQQFDPDKVVVRLSDQDLFKIYKRRLNKSDCLNKGYILDGWPKSSEQCKALFCDENGEVNQQIFPNACFSLDPSEDQVKQRIKNLPVEKKEGTHWNEQATARRFQVYSQINSEGSALSFLKDKVDIKEVPFAYEGTQDFISFIERNGPLGFKKKVKAEEKKGEDEGKEEEQKEEQKKENEGEEEDEEQPEPQEEDQPEPQQQEAQFDLEKLTAHQKEILNEKSRPIRQYLIDNVIPQITQGLLQICKQAPRDPIQFLIRFLENKEKLKALKK